MNRIKFMDMLERIRALDTGKKKIVLAACVTIGMAIVLSLWLFITPPLLPANVEGTSAKISNTAQNFKETLTELRSATTEVTGAIQELSETIKNTASTSQSMTNEPAETSTTASSTPQ